jgi:hypothetical protein
MIDYINCMPFHRLKNKGWYLEDGYMEAKKQKPYVNGQSALLGD